MKIINYFIKKRFLILIFIILYASIFTIIINSIELIAETNYIHTDTNKLLNNDSIQDIFSNQNVILLDIEFLKAIDIYQNNARIKPNLKNYLNSQTNQLFTIGTFNESLESLKKV